MCFLWQFLLNYLFIHFERDEPVLRIVINFSSFATIFEKLNDDKKASLLTLQLTVYVVLDSK